MPDGHLPRHVGVLAGLAATTMLMLIPAATAFADTQSLDATAPLRFEAGPDGQFTVGDGRHFVDTLEFASFSGALLVNELGMEDYVAGIAEMPGRWHLEALKAQAVAARTYGWYSIERDSFDGYDVCATVACQVFRGADTWLDVDTGERWLEAVRATAGEVLVDDDGAPILARYFSTSGGRTYANEDVFPDSGERPYLVAIEDPYDAASPYHRWTARFTRAEFDEVLSRGDTLAATVPVETVERLGTADDPQALVRVTGQDGTVVEVGARDLREFLSRVAPQRFPDRFPSARNDGLRPLPATVPSSRFDIEVTDDEVVLHGRGWGHGVGLGQYGALGRARDGHSYAQVLAAYYNGLEPSQTDALPERIRVGLDVDVPDGGLTVAADGLFRIVAGGEVLVDRALGTWTVRTDGGGWTVAPPVGHDADLEVADTRLVTDLDVGDAVMVETEVNKPVLLRLEVHDAAGEQVLVRDLGAADAGQHAATWRFHDGDGEPVPPGDYAVALVAEDAAGSVDGTPVAVPVPDGPAGGGAGERATDGVPVALLVVVAAAVLPLALIVVVAANRKSP